jgi:hypothetical protein
MKDDNGRQPLHKRLPQSDDIHDMQVPMAIEVDFVTSAKLSDMGILETVLDLAVKDLQKRFEKDGFKCFLRTGLVRPMTQEELLTIIPRKVHMARDAQQICDTPHVSKKNLTEDPDDVTCKKCLKILGRDA